MRNSKTILAVAFTAVVLFSVFFLGTVWGNHAQMFVCVDKHVRDVGVTNVVSAIQGATATCTTTLSIPNGNNADMLFQVHDVLNSELSNWLAIFGSFLTVFGFLVPLISYIYQSQVLSREKQEIIAEARRHQEECEANFHARLQKEVDRFESGKQELWKSMAVNSIGMCQSYIEGLRRNGGCAKHEWSMFFIWLSISLSHISEIKLDEDADGCSQLIAGLSFITGHHLDDSAKDAFREYEQNTHGGIAKQIVKLKKREGLDLSLIEELVKKLRG